MSAGEGQRGVRCGLRPHARTHTLAACFLRYGEKHVKGSLHPRSYYKCSYQGPENAATSLPRSRDTRCYTRCCVFCLHCLACGAWRHVASMRQELCWHAQQPPPTRRLLARPCCRAGCTAKKTVERNGKGAIVRTECKVRVAAAASWVGRATALAVVASGFGLSASLPTQASRAALGPRRRPTIAPVQPTWHASPCMPGRQARSAAHTSLVRHATARPQGSHCHPAPSGNRHMTARAAPKQLRSRCHKEKAPQVRARPAGRTCCWWFPCC